MVQHSKQSMILLLALLGILNYIPVLVVSMLHLIYRRSPEDPKHSLGQAGIATLAGSPDQAPWTLL